jgi:D-alanyl-D-alanine carboxypeptidase
MAAIARRGSKTSVLARLLAVALPAVCLLCPRLAHAQVGSDRYSSIVVDAATGNVLEAANPDAPRHPASLAKLMTLYMTFEALRDRRITLDQDVPVSAHAASMEPSKLGLLPGTRLTVQQAILALVTKSANDAASALGELLGGSEDRFAQMMTLRARSLGMSHTTFTNASGLPDPNEWTTARDLAVLARQIVANFPSDYSYFSTPSFTFQRRVIFNHDSMLRSYPGADGMKTGYTEASGHNLLTSAQRDGVRLIGVVLGAGSNAERDVHMAALLNQGFTEMDVPIDRHPTLVASRVGFIGVAHAATIEPARPVVREPAHAKGAPPPPVWGVQVGTFPTEKAARLAASTAHRIADDGDARVEAVTLHGHTTWRAQLSGMTVAEAQDACSVLTRHRTPCFVLHPESRQLASR